MRTIAFLALAGLALAKKHIHGEHAHHVAHHGEHAHHAGEHHVAHHGEHAHHVVKAQSGPVVVNRGAWAFYKKVHGGEDSHTKKNKMSKRSRRGMRKVHGGEDAKKTRRGRKVHGGENAVARRNRRGTKKVATQATLALFKKVHGGEDSLTKKNKMSKRSKRQMRKVHGGEDSKRKTRRGMRKVHGGESAKHKNRRPRTQRGENARHKKRNTKKVAKMDIVVTKAPAAMGLYELSNALNLNQI